MRIFFLSPCPYDQTGVAVKYRLLTGLTAGALAAFWAAVHEHVFPTLAWGTAPLLLGIIPFAAGLLSGRPLLLDKPPAGWRRFAPPAVALATPPLLFLAYQLTAAFAFIGGDGGILTLLFTAVVYAIGAGLPLDALTAAEAASPRDASQGDRLPWLLLGAGFGFLGVSILQDGLDLRILWIVQAAAAVPLLLRLPQESAPNDAEITSQERRLRLPSPWDAVRYAAPLLLAFLLPFLFQAMAEIPAFSDGLRSRMPAAVLLAVGLGWKAGLLTARRGQGLAVGILFFVITGALLLNMAGAWINDWFPDIYIAYYQSGDATFQAQMFAVHLLGALFFAAAGAAHVRRAEDTPLPVSILIIQFTAGYLAAIFLPNALYFTWLLLGAGILVALLSLYLLLRIAARNTATGILGALWLAQLLLIADIGDPGFRNFFNPTSFQVVAEEYTPAGRMTLLQSRDYDDRFHAVFWNQQSALTQSSRAVRSDLLRMGHLPMLMGKTQARVLMLGLGSSLALEAVAMHNPSSIVCIEPSETMLRLSQATAKTARPRPWLRDVRFYNERVEAYLARSDETADVIVSAEPLAEAGTAPILLTTEWFTAIANHLAPDGIFAQWLPVAHLDLNAMRPVFAAVLTVFPHAEIWITSPDPENAMVGIFASKSPFTPDRPSRSRLESLLSSSQKTRDHLRRIKLGSWPSLLSAYGGDAAVLRKLAQNAAPYGSFDHIPRRGIDALQETLLDVNTLLTERSAPRRFTADLSDSLRAVTAALFDQRPLVMRAKTAALVGDDSSAVRLLTEIVESTPANEEASRALGDILLRQAAGYVGGEQYGPALQLITQALTLMPVNTYLLRLLMISAFHVGDREASGLAIDGIRRLDPSHAGFRDNQATIRAQQGATDDALLLYENAITLDQTNEEFYCNMASFHYSQGRIWEAIRVLDQATKRAYYPAKPYYLKGLFYAEQGRIALALEAYESYLRVASPLDPHRAEVPRRIDELIEFREKQP